jgi:hypothetical protein
VIGHVVFTDGNVLFFDVGDEKRMEEFFVRGLGHGVVCRRHSLDPPPRVVLVHVPRNLLDMQAEIERSLGVNAREWMGGWEMVPCPCRAATVSPSWDHANEHDITNVQKGCTAAGGTRELAERTCVWRGHAVFYWLCLRWSTRGRHGDACGDRR